MHCGSKQKMRDGKGKLKPIDRNSKQDTKIKMIHVSIPKMKLETLSFGIFRTSKILLRNFMHFHGKFDIFKLRYRKGFTFL